MPQDLLTALFYLLLGGLLNYVVNQLPSLKQFRGSGILLVLLAIELLLLGWIWQVSSAKDELYQAHQVWFDNGKLILFGALAVNLLLLGIGLLRSESAQAAVPQLNLRDRLLQAELEEVEKRRDDSLHNEILIDLNMTDEREQVGRPSKQLITNGSTVDLPAATRMVEVFRNSKIGGRLLILGDPGAGKTTMLLELAKALLETGQQDPNAPVAVILELSTWREDQKTLTGWLIEQLWQKYKLDRTISREWLASGQILPLLDGLDELGLDRQQKAMTAIDHYLKADAKLDLVVCCRWEEYQEAQSRLTQLNGAVRLQSLTEPQIQDYLNQLGKADLWHSIQSDPELLELAQLPLLLHIMVIAYQGQPIRNRQDLFDAYILRRFELKPRKQVYPIGKEPSQKQTRSWLTWIAKRMQETNETEFLIERLQPRWLATRHQKWLYRLIGGLIGGLIGWLISGLIFGLIFGLTDGQPTDEPLDVLLNMLFSILVTMVFVGPFIGLFVGLFVGLFAGNDIDLVKGVQISITHLSERRTLQRICLNWVGGLILTLAFWPISGGIVGAIVGLIFGIISNLISGEIFKTISGLTTWLTIGLASGIIFGLIIWLIGGLIGGLIDGLRVDLQTCLSPNQDVKASAKNVVILVPLILMMFLFSWFYLTSFIRGTPSQANIDLMFLLLLIGIALISFFYCGGFACVQHLALRIVLWHSKLSPWNYAKFLEYAAERRLIQQVGGRYRFIHRLLRDHFAAMG